MIMKIIITESKRTKLIFTALNSMYGDLDIIDTTRNNNIVFFTKKDYKTINKDTVIMFLNVIDQYLYIPYEMLMEINLFTSDDWESKQFIIKWMKETYDFDVSMVFLKE
jgi:hypothetical protein